MAALRHRLIDHRHGFRGEKGYTLVEVMVAMLLCSIMVTSIFSVVLTVKTGGSKGESKIRASAGARQIAALLKNFVTAEAGTASTVAPNIPGPCVGAVNNWSITCNGVTDACPGGGSNCYALAPGTHTLTGVMGTLFEGTPWNARVMYHVTDASGGAGIPGGRPVPAVSITTTWTDP
jgi:prepilin-type N-terminal cleavage/methylation domain-containing protein